MKAITLLATIVFMGMSLPAHSGGDQFENTPMTTWSQCALEAVDWSQAEVVTVDMYEYGFSPNQISFNVCRPYILNLVNAGTRSHSFYSEKFFETVFTLGVDGYVAPMTEADVESLDLRIDEQIQFYFVPMVPGQFDLVCSHAMHGALGMTGKIYVR